MSQVDLAKWGRVAQNDTKVEGRVARCARGALGKPARRLSTALCATRCVAPLAPMMGFAWIASFSLEPSTVSQNGSAYGLSWSNIYCTCVCVKVAYLEGSMRNQYLTPFPGPSTNPCQPRRPINEGFAIRNPALPQQLNVIAEPGDTTAAQPARRGDAPLVLAYSRGVKHRAIEFVQAQDGQCSARDLVASRAYAASSHSSRACKLQTWDEVAAASGHPSPLLTAEAIETVAGAFIAGEYRSTASYLELAIDRHLELGGSWPEVCERATKRARRAATRGLGPPSKAAPYPLHRHQSIVLPEFPSNTLHPIGGVRCMAILCWFALREIELSNIIVEDLRFTGDIGRVHLSASKSDQTALSVHIELPCYCMSVNMRADLCPVCALKRQVTMLHRVFPELSLAAARQLPLFPTASGSFVTKRDMVGFINAAGAATGESANTNSGALRWGGHAGRRGGIQLLSTLGASTIDVQAHARHSSSATLGYLQGLNAAALRAAIIRAGWKIPTNFSLVIGASALEAPAKVTATAGDHITSKTGAKVHQVAIGNAFTICKWSFRHSATVKVTQLPISCALCLLRIDISSNSASS
jgi:hypothetical protein